MEGTIIVLGVFAVLAIIGIIESAVVALTIFIFHLSTLTLFCVFGVGSMLSECHIFKGILV